MTARELAPHRALRVDLPHPDAEYWPFEGDDWPDEYVGGGTF